MKTFNKYLMICFYTFLATVLLVVGTSLLVVQGSWLYIVAGIVYTAASAFCHLQILRQMD
jgi:hypothetical protein